METASTAYIVAITMRTTMIPADRADETVTSAIANKTI
jgi:hypothetical protein